MKGKGFEQETYKADNNIYKMLECRKIAFQNKFNIRQLHIICSYWFDYHLFITFVDSSEYYNSYKGC